MPILFLTKRKRIFAKKLLGGSETFDFGEEGCLFGDLFSGEARAFAKENLKIKKNSANSLFG